MKFYTKLTLLLYRVPYLSKNIKVLQRFLTQDVKPLKQIPREKPAIGKRTSVLTGYPLLIVPITTFALGTWQVYRRDWKLKLIQDLEEKMRMPPEPLPADLSELKSMEYRKVKVRGTFDHSREMYIGPRSNLHAPTHMSANNKAATIGVHVVTPLKLSDRDATILVNRGHVKYELRPPQMRPKGQVEGEVEIVGVVRTSDKSISNMFKTDPLKEGYWLSREVEEMADIAGTSEVFIDADIDSSVPGGPEGGQTVVALRNEHLVYAVTWYSLAALTFFFWWKTYRTPKVSRLLLDKIKKNYKQVK